MSEVATEPPGFDGGELCVLDPRGSISTVTVPFIAYLAFFVVTLFGSGAGLFQYRGTEKGGGDG